VLFVHGNVSSSLFWHPAMLGLPGQYRPLAIDLRGFGDTDPEPVHATRGLRDYADDLAAVIAALGLSPVHLVGWSMGGGAVLQYLADRPDAHQVASLTLVAPVSPFGFGGTRDAQGTLCDPGAGCGGGAANPDFVARLAAGDRTDESPLSPRQVLLAHYVKPPQPMLAQTRAVLDGYAAAGGRYREVAIDDAANSPHLDQPERFLAELGRHLSSA
jgi:pimeloyl-ACP methyl ester carboxylesterase